MCQTACQESQHAIRELCWGQDNTGEFRSMWKKNLNLQRPNAVNKMQRKNVYKDLTPTGYITSGNVVWLWCIMFHHGTHHWSCSRTSLSLHELGSWFMLVRCAALQACLFRIVYLSVLMGVRTSAFWAPVSAEWQVESLRVGGCCDGRSSYVWFKDWHGSEQERRGGFPLWGGRYGGSSSLCTSCLPRFVIPNHLFCMRTCLCHESSIKGTIYHAKTKGVCHELLISSS